MRSKANLQLRAVGRALSRWRRNDGRSLIEVCRLVGWSNAKLSMQENAVRVIYEADVIALALVYRIGPEERLLVCHGAQRAHDPIGWDRVTGGAVPYAGWTCAEVEAEASVLRIVATDVVPPPARTRGYAEALGGRCGEPREDQALQLILSEAVLRRPVGGRRVLVGQLVRLMELAGLPHVTIQVLPDETGIVGAPFTVLSFTGDHFDDVVLVEQLHADVWLETEEERRPYDQMFTKLRRAALPPDESLEHIAGAVQRLQDAVHA